MALKYAVGSGDWSDAATWNGGTLPSLEDEVYANGFTVTLDMDFTVQKISTDVCPDTLTGAGSFSLISGTRNISCNVEAGLSSCITNASASFNLIVTGNMAGGSATNAAGLNYAGGVNSTTAFITIYGNLTAGTGSGANGIRHAPGAGAGRNISVTVVGNVTSYASNRAISVVTSSSYGTVSNFNITGTSTGAILGICNAVNNFVLNGVLVSSSSEPMVIGMPGSLFTINGAVVQTSSKVALDSQDILVAEGGVIEYTFKEANTGSDILVRSATPGGGYPAEADVRGGVLFGVIDELTGSLAVPDPSNVRKGVATDNTIGTAELTAEDILEAIEVSTNPIAERLRNVSTVQTTGDQIASLNTQEE